MASDRVNEAKTGEAICDTICFEDSSFVKTLRNLQSLELPASFVKQHGRNFQVRVVLRGPSGRLVAVHLTIESSPVQDRVHFRGCEWRDFLCDNGFKVGHELMFSLVSKSTFVVRHSGAANANIRLGGEVRHRREANNAIAHKPWVSQVESDVVYARNMSWHSKHLQRVNMLVGDLQCPHFVLRIKKSHLREWKSSSLSVPREFYNKYATYFCNGANIFQGPNGRMMSLRYSHNSLRFTSGWKAFHRENGIRLGDVMLFSLCEPARWLIQFVERKVEEVSVESGCDSSELE